MSGRSVSTSSASSEHDEDMCEIKKFKTEAEESIQSLIEIEPIKVDGSVKFCSIGGLQEHIKCLREMVIFPITYADFFQQFQTRPPKGVLFHGPPGTGKTLLARALANECGLVRGKKVSFFMRKGADVMSKWYGESEKWLKSLFHQANKMKPSIIFFDEVDALAPARNSSFSEAYTSIVATLLAEMDGLEDRGDVIVIGATNRPDALDPALRRPGRFDRELYFPPPDLDARREILDIYTKDWLPRPSVETLDYIAQATNGYLGSDLNALCSEAVLKSLRRVYPEIYEGGLQNKNATVLEPQKVEVTREDLLSAVRMLKPAAARAAPIPSRCLPAHAEPLLRAQLHASLDMLRACSPPCTDRRVSGMCAPPGVFLVSGECADTLLAPALLARLEPCAVRELSVATLHATHVCTQEQALIALFAECRQADRGGVIFIPDVLSVWDSLDTTQGSALLLQLWRTRAAGDNTLLLATCDVKHEELPEELQELFPVYKECVYRVRKPTPAEVISFLKPVVTEMPLLPPRQDTEPTSLAVPKKVNAGSSRVNAYDKNRKRHSQDCYSKGPDAKRAKVQMNYTENNRAPDSNYYDRNTSSLLEVIINKNELDIIVNDHVEALRHIGLEALLDLHEQLTRVVSSYCGTHDRSKLPKQLLATVARYAHMPLKNRPAHKACQCTTGISK